jgi:hypothetical protein
MSIQFSPTFRELAAITKIRTNTTMTEAQAIPSPPNEAASTAAPDLSSWLEITHQAATLIDPKVGNSILLATRY